MRVKETTSSKILTYAILLMCAFLWILPLGIAVTKSFTVNGFGNYAYVLQYDKIHYSRVISNSMFISVTVSVVVTLITSLAGYAFPKCTSAAARSSMARSWPALQSPSRP